jgi:hypothetical protein
MGITHQKGNYQKIGENHIRSITPDAQSLRKQENQKTNKNKRHDEECVNHRIEILMLSFQFFEFLSYYARM